MLSHQGEEGGVVISGQIELTVGGQSRVLGPGDAFYFLARVRIDSATSARRRVRSSLPVRRRPSEVTK